MTGSDSQMKMTAHTHITYNYIKDNRSEQNVYVSYPYLYRHTQMQVYIPEM